MFVLEGLELLLNAGQTNAFEVILAQKWESIVLPLSSFLVDDIMGLWLDHAHGDVIASFLHALSRLEFFSVDLDWHAYYLSITSLHSVNIYVVIIIVGSISGVFSEDMDLISEVDFEVFHHLVGETLVVHVEIEHGGAVLVC